ncbi:MAG: hypothetical protein KDC93_08750 [Cyclobacteriaceae bacterium]|nr:hypothetical protein [Cyclobacteriaceae bacterium]
MKRVIILVFVCFTNLALSQDLVFPFQYGWNILTEGDELKFKLAVKDSVPPRFFSLDGFESTGIQFDTLGNFYWQPAYDLVDRLEKQKDFNVIFEVSMEDGRKARSAITFTVLHKNRPPSIEELPVVYVKMASSNSYQIPAEYIRDLDGDPITFRPVQEKMPQGANLSSLGLFTWTPSKSQFYALRDKPLTIEFFVEDQPDKASSLGKLKIAQTQMDLPPELLIVPGDSSITVSENELVNLKIYVSDPNGDDNVAEVGFVCSDPQVPKTSFKENTKVQSEFIWKPGYEFVEESEVTKEVDFTFYAIDNANNRTQRKVRVTVKDAENIDEKDKLSYIKYRNSLIQAKGLIDILDDNHETLSKAYKKAKKGKKNRALINASLGATTGLSPVILSTDPSKVVSAIGGTTVLTLGTLEATELLGKSKNDILEKMKVNVEIRNQLQVAGDNFARKYALKSSRRNQEFDIDRDKLLPIINNQKLVILEIDASKPSYKDYSDKDLKKTFPDFSSE